MRRGFTLIELLVVIAIIAVLAAILFPVFSRVRAKAQQTTCLSQMRQIGQAMAMYTTESDQRLPDRRDLKSSLPGRYRPWTGWPASDPRAGWAQIVLNPYLKSPEIWRCRSSQDLFKARPEVIQTTPLGQTNVWMWRFDKPDDEIPLDNLWGKLETQAVEDLRASGNPQVGLPESPSDVELLVDAYFPKTIATVPAELRGRTPHFGGRNRLFLDSRVKFLRDARTD
ncbi:MAG TPA: prepilin-type N-terminal cleavage/methylation domain-containing protein [Fimbriimonadaceae bacterium]|nr:prepilin-type N-terminal cleavage/methylation domain-containing protein [Fimbriimonadaceae bacterium]HRJ32358.1 prepilin-type N-terminal cleavage/methylation domain-containing protein [Fimbriimonadaceae bacterium]